MVTPEFCASKSFKTPSIASVGSQSPQYSSETALPVAAVPEVPPDVPEVPPLPVPEPPVPAVPPVPVVPPDVPLLPPVGVVELPPPTKRMIKKITKNSKIKPPPINGRYFMNGFLGWTKSSLGLAGVAGAG